MKKLTLTSLLLIITLAFSSCNVEEDLLLSEDTSGKLFEKVTVKRDANGAYTLDMKLKEGVGADFEDNKELNRKDVNLYTSNGQTKKSFNENLYFDGNESLQVGVNDTHSNNKSVLTVYDNDFKFDRSTEDDHLADYSFTDNGDGTYDLDFVVDNDIVTEFVYNEDTKTYEIHLEPGESTENEFMRTFTKQEGESLKIVFINYFSRQSSSRLVTSTNKPKVVIDNGGGTGGGAS